MTYSSYKDFETNTEHPASNWYYILQKKHTSLSPPSKVELYNYLRKSMEETNLEFWPFSLRIHILRGEDIIQNFSSMFKTKAMLANFNIKFNNIAMYHIHSTVKNREHPSLRVLTQVVQNFNFLPSRYSVQKKDPLPHHPMNTLKKHMSYLRV